MNKDHNIQTTLDKKSKEYVAKFQGSTSWIIDEH